MCISWCLTNISQVKVSPSLHGLLDNEGVCITIFLNLGKYLAVDTVLTN
jgi:hypothetical protein